jgi:hypothetical protein
MEGEDFEDEELLVSNSIGLTFHGFDFVVGAFEWVGRSEIAVIGQAAEGVEAEGLGELMRHLNAAGLGAANPSKRNASSLSSCSENSANSFLR